MLKGFDKITLERDDLVDWLRRVKPVGTLNRRGG